MPGEPTWRCSDMPVVDIRVMGSKELVYRIVGELESRYNVVRRKGPYRNRRNNGVRVYLKVEVE